MSKLPIPEWTTTLERMGANLNRTLQELDRYQVEWGTVTETPAVATPPDLLLAWLERRLNQWDSRLTEAAELTATIEKQLQERELAVQRWQNLFVAWRELIEQHEPITERSEPRTSG